MQPLERPAPLLTHRADGAILIRNACELASYPVSMTERLLHWAQVAPERRFIARRDAGGQWQSWTYAETLRRVRHLAAELLPLQLSAERPVAILSGNSLEHALLGLASMYIGVPYSPVSTAYSTSSGDHAKLRHVIELLTPGLVAVFADSEREHSKYETALSAAVNANTTTLRRLPAAAADPAALAAADAAEARVNGDTIAKLLLTSGSTGVPKAVITTQRMLCSNQQMLHGTFPFLATEAPVLVDWLPWNHVFGGSHNFGMVLYNGGTLYIDDGRPMPGAIETTLRNLREFSPTIYLNVPMGFEALAHHLERDDQLRQNFYRRVKCLAFGGAMVGQAIIDRLDATAIATTGERVPIICGLGSTETAPALCFTNADIRGSGRIGLPVPGVQLKLQPTEGKFELRAKGPNITPGYWRRPELSSTAFDTEGYYGLGDAVKLVDIKRPELGLLFDGRIAEDFKLASGTWVSVGPLRAALIAAFSPLVQDVIIAGLNRDYLTGLIILDLQHARAAAPGIASDAPLAAVAAHPVLRQQLLDRLRTHAAANRGSSTRLERALVLTTTPSLDAGEVTDKGSINQRAVLQAPATLVESLYAEPPGAAVLVVASENAA